MKKIILGASLMAVGGVALAQTALNTGTTTNVTTNACTLLQSSVTVGLSAGNIGAYDCNTNTASVGVAVSSTTGRNRIYSLGSAGGAITETTRSSAADTAACGTQAVARSAVS